jgi:hypothetical protein
VSNLAVPTIHFSYYPDQFNNRIWYGSSVLGIGNVNHSMPALAETNVEGMGVVSSGSNNPKTDLSASSEGDSFTVFTRGKTKAVRRKEQPQRSSNGSRNQKISRVNASNQVDCNRRYHAALFSSFGRRTWAKPSSETIPSNQTVLPPIARKGTDSDPLEQAGPGLSSQELSITPASLSLEANSSNSEVGTTNLNSNDFMLQYQTQSLSALMEDYGTFDPDWMKVSVPEQSGVLTDSIKADDIPKNSHEILNCEMNQNDTNQLQTHGRAPIHVEFVSFGYRHGIPPEIRQHSTGNSYRQPLPPFDTRTILAPIPPHLAWMDGKSTVVKSAMLRWQRTSTVTPCKDEQMNVRVYAEDVLGPRVADAVLNAMDTGGHGYASPLTMTIFVGSEQGQHRSVVASELGATALRQRLRQNQGQRFGCAVSVGCRHRDLTPHHRNSGKSAASKKQKAFEED